MSLHVSKCTSVLYISIYKYTCINRRFRACVLSVWKIHKRIGTAANKPHILPIQIAYAYTRVCVCVCINVMRKSNVTADDVGSCCAGCDNQEQSRASASLFLFLKVRSLSLSLSCCFRCADVWMLWTLFESHFHPHRHLQPQKQLQL